MKKKFIAYVMLLAALTFMSGVGIASAETPCPLGGLSIGSLNRNLSTVAPSSNLSGLLKQLGINQNLKSQGVVLCPLSQILNRTAGVSGNQSGWLRVSIGGNKPLSTTNSNAANNWFYFTIGGKRSPVTLTPPTTTAPVATTPTTTTPPVVTTPPVSTTPGADIAALENEIFGLINQYRQSQGLPVLTLNSFESDQARQHSLNMAAKIVPFGHDGFAARVANIRAQIGGSSFAENAAYNQGFQDPGQTAVTGWLNSPEHLKNIIGDYSLTGVGVASDGKGNYYFTQIFSK